MSFLETISAQENVYFTELFQRFSKKKEGFVTTNEAVSLFAKSYLPQEQLAEIWEKADRDKIGEFSKENFFIALKCIAQAQKKTYPTFEGVNVVPPSPVMFNSPSNLANNQVISQEEREKFANIFKGQTLVNGQLESNKAMDIFSKSNLSKETLSQIWKLAGISQSGYVNQTEFTIAMYHITRLLTNSPNALPLKVHESDNATTQRQPLLDRNMTISSPAALKQRQFMTPPQRARTIDSLGNLAFGSAAPAHEPVVQQWDVTLEEKKQFDMYFDKIDSRKEGKIQGGAAVDFFRNSRLPDEDLRHIWGLSTLQQSDALTRDEFAVAMHLIHAKIAGKELPRTLPPTLVPPSSRKQVQQSPLVTNSVMTNITQVPSSPAMYSTSPAPLHSKSLFDDDAQVNDLLGDFGNDQVSDETNNVNLLKNQISSMSVQNAGLGQQRQSAEDVLEQLLNQKKALEAQLTAVRMDHESAVKELNECQENVRREENGWDQVRAEYDAAQQQLNAVQNEMEQTKQKLENGRAETESLQRRVAEIQADTNSANAELDTLRERARQQSMMLDINRRQVTAAEQDRSEAKRHLEDYKIAGGLNNKEESDEDVDDSVFADSKAENASNEIMEDSETAKSPETEPSAVSTPALHNLFGESPTVRSKSPFGANSFDNFFEAHPSRSTTASNSDFDAIFGNIGSPAAPTTPGSANWASPTTPSSTKSSRAPPPPPPQSRHHRQASDTSSILSIPSSAAGKKRAPPPPPPAPGQIPEIENDSDEFEAAFSGKLSEAKIGNVDDFANFDDAFSAFDIKAVPPAASPQKPNAKEVTSSSSPATNNNWAANFGGFNFPGDDTVKKTANNNTSTSPFDTIPSAENSATTAPIAGDDWDSIFSISGNKSNVDKSKTSDPVAATATTSDNNVEFDDAFSSFKPTSAVPTAAAATSSNNAGFDDAFSSFGDGFGKQPATPTTAASSISKSSPVVTSNKPANTISQIGIVGDKIKDLVKMGFAEQEAKDALNRYDQDLEKASNFLLDQVSRN